MKTIKCDCGKEIKRGDRVGKLGYIVMCGDCLDRWKTEERR